jgi:hypothetical protein
MGCHPMLDRLRLRWRGREELQASQTRLRQNTHHVPLFLPRIHPCKMHDGHIHQRSEGQSDQAAVRDSEEADSLENNVPRPSSPPFLKWPRGDDIALASICTDDGIPSNDSCNHVKAKHNINAADVSEKTTLPSQELGAPFLCGRSAPSQGFHKMLPAMHRRSSLKAACKEYCPAGPVRRS